MFVWSRWLLTIPFGTWNIPILRGTFSSFAGYSCLVLILMVWIIHKATYLTHFFKSRDLKQKKTSSVWDRHYLRCTHIFELTIFLIAVLPWQHVRSSLSWNPRPRPSSFRKAASFGIHDQPSSKELSPDCRHTSKSTKTDKHTSKL